MQRFLQIWITVVSVCAFWACTDSKSEDIPARQDKEIMVLFGPNAWGDNGYNDLIYKGVLSYIKEDKTPDVKVYYYNPASIDEAERIVKAWKEDSLSEKKRLLVLANAVYQDIAISEFTDYPTDTTRQQIVLFESDGVDLPGVCTFRLSMYGTSYISGAVVGKLAFTPLIVMASSTDSSVVKAAEGFRNGYADFSAGDMSVRQVYISDTNKGYAMPDSAYMKMYDWTKFHDFIFPVMGGSIMGVFRYIREYPSRLFTVGMDVDQSHLCSNLFGNMLKHMDVVVKHYLNSWVSGDRLPHCATYGLRDGYTDWIPGSVSLEEYGVMLEKIKSDAITKENGYENF